MDAPVKRTIFDIIGKNNLVFKLIFFAKINSSQETIHLFENSVKKYQDEITGLLLVYSNYILCLVESSERIIFEFGSNILSSCSGYLETCRCFPIHYSDGRFFPRWYSREIFPKTSENCSHLEIKDLYENVLDHVYKLYWEFKTSDFLEEKLDVLAEKSDDRLPSPEILELLIKNPWGFDLKIIIDRYYENLEPEEDEIWPIQKI